MGRHGSGGEGRRASPPPYDWQRPLSCSALPPLSPPRQGLPPTQHTWYSHCGPTGITMRPPARSLRTRMSGREEAAASAKHRGWGQGKRSARNGIRASASSGSCGGRHGVCERGRRCRRQGDAGRHGAARLRRRGWRQTAPPRPVRARPARCPPAAARHATFDEGREGYKPVAATGKPILRPPTPHPHPRPHHSLVTRPLHALHTQHTHSTARTSTTLVSSSSGWSRRTLSTDCGGGQGHRSGRGR